MINRTRAALGLCFVLAALAVACVPPAGPGTTTTTVPGNIAPVAVASATPLSGDAPLEVQFSSQDSTDSDGTIVERSWDFGDSSAPSTDADPVHFYLTPGVYTAELTVTDDDGATGTDSVEITVTAVVDDPNGRYVATTGADDNDCSASATPCATVNHAVGQAEAGDTVYVAAGTYPEVVTVDESLSFRGANAGISAGSTPGSRGAESVVKGFRNPGTWTGGAGVGTTQFDVTIDGFRIDPQGDTTLISATAQPLVWLRGGAGTGVTIVNNVLSGADVNVPGCGFTCTTMADQAVTVQSGTVLLGDNGLSNFRRPVNIVQPVGAPALDLTIADNAISGATSRSIGIGGATGVQMPGATVSGNVIETASTSTPGGIVVSNGGNQITGNTISGHSSAVWIDICKKWVTRNNVVTGNTLSNNRYGLYTGISQTGACQNDTQPVAGGGDINGLVATGNNISGNSVRGVQISLGIGWSTFTQILPDGPIDLSCNYWGDPSGPANATYNPDGTGDSLSITSPGTATFIVTPFRTAPAPDGACDGV
jgi:PKD repeat protein